MKGIGTRVGVCLEKVVERVVEHQGPGGYMRY